MILAYHYHYYYSLPADDNLVQLGCLPLDPSHGSAVEMDGCVVADRRADTLTAICKFNANSGAES